MPVARRRRSVFFPSSSRASVPDGRIVGSEFEKSTAASARADELFLPRLRPRGYAACVPSDTVGRQTSEENVRYLHFITSALAVAAVAGQAFAAGEKKLIEFGWDEPDTAFLRQHAASMEN